MSNELSTMWSYNGIELPKLPEWDKEKYPYACIHQSLPILGSKYCFSQSSEPFKWEPDGGFLLLYSPYSSWLENDEWTQGIQFTGWWDQAVTVVWTNVDILQEDGTLHFAASEPVPIFQIEPMSFYKGVYIGQMIASTRLRFVAKEPYTWETLYENKVTYEETKAGNPTRYFAEIWSDDEPPAVSFYEGEIIRLTTGGASKIYTVKLDEYGDAYFGNRTLSFDAIDGESDNGDNFCFTVLVESYGFEYLSFARNPGTYQIKIERAVESRAIPVAYLYNEDRLPNIDTVWVDKESRPYAFIWKAKQGAYKYYLFLLSEQVSIKDYHPVARDDIYFTVPDDTELYVLTAEDGAWTKESLSYKSYYAYAYNTPTTAPQVNSVWSSFDVNRPYNESIYIEASEPIPVYQ